MGTVDWGSATYTTIGYIPAHFQNGGIRHVIIIKIVRKEISMLRWGYKSNKSLIWSKIQRPVAAMYQSVLLRYLAIAHQFRVPLIA